MTQIEVQGRSVEVVAHRLRHHQPPCAGARLAAAAELTLLPVEGDAALGWREPRALRPRCVNGGTCPGLREIKGLGRIVANPGGARPPTAASPTWVLLYKHRVCRYEQRCLASATGSAVVVRGAPPGGGGWSRCTAPVPESAHVMDAAPRRSISLARSGIRSGRWRCPASRRTRAHHDVEGTREHHRAPDRGQVRRWRQQSHAGSRAGLGLNGGHTGGNASWGQRGFPDRWDRFGLVFEWERRPMREASRLAADRAPKSPGGDCGEGAGGAAAVPAAFAAAGSGGVDRGGGAADGGPAGPVARGGGARHRPGLLRQAVSR